MERLHQTLGIPPVSEEELLPFLKEQAQRHRKALAGVRSIIGLWEFRI